MKLLSKTSVSQCPEKSKPFSIKVNPLEVDNSSLEPSLKLKIFDVFVIFLFWIFLLIYKIIFN